ncbi:MAG TPA: PEP-CTERM sorting domain-containing protein [Gemmatales bacterium]|nr:PEP-CTERM sorting domain-containing protein [Gemmatales bacterium]
MLFQSFRRSIIASFLACGCLLLLTLCLVAADLTIVFDFKPTGSPNTTAITGDTISTFNFSAFGFPNDAANFATLTASITNEVRNIYYGLPTNNVDSRSPIPINTQLRIDFVQGTIGQPPSNGATEYYYAQIGTGVSGPSIGALGVAQLNAVRTSSGTHPGGVANHAIVASVFANNIQGLGSLTPSNALTTGNLAFSTYALAGTLAHEIGHTLSLSHMNKAGSITPTGLPPIMGTGALDLPNQDRIGPREFAYSGFDGENSNAARAHVQQLVNALGVRTVPEPMTMSLIGIVIISGGVWSYRRKKQRVRLMEQQL